MTLNQTGLDFICQNFGLENCCTNSGLSWYYVVGNEYYPESGGTAQIVSRLASGLIDSLTITTPDRGTFTKADLDVANGAPVTFQDAQEITNHDSPLETQWCLGGAEAPPSATPLPYYILVGGVIAVAVVAGVIVWQKR